MFLTGFLCIGLRIIVSVVLHSSALIHTHQCTVWTAFAPSLKLYISLFINWDKDIYFQSLSIFLSFMVLNLGTSEVASLSSGFTLCFWCFSWGDQCNKEVTWQQLDKDMRVILLLFFFSHVVELCHITKSTFTVDVTNQNQWELETGGIIGGVYAYS